MSGLKGIVGPRHRVRHRGVVADRITATAAEAQRRQWEQVERCMLAGDDTVRLPSITGNGQWIEYQAPTWQQPIRRLKLLRARRRHRRELRGGVMERIRG